jgi:ABC-type sugar transport system ATPase subunit
VAQAALAGSPRLLLLDEPMAHLDMQLKIGLLEELQQRLSLTTIYITTAPSLRL